MIEREQMIGLQRGLGRKPDKDTGKEWYHLAGFGEYAEGVSVHESVGEYESLQVQRSGGWVVSARCA